MKRFWCLLLVALFLLGCTPDPDAEVVFVTAAPTAQAATAAPVPTPAPTEIPKETPSPTPELTPTPTLSPEERLMRYVEAMTDAEKIGQLCMFGFSGTVSVSDAFSEILQTYHIGSVILYGQNMSRGNTDGGFAQCRKLSDSVRAASRSEIPLLISTDVEGGSVTRFHWKNTLLSARTLGKRNDPALAEEQFRYIAEGLLSAGINVDLAPCLDVCKNPDGSFLGKRILSSDAQIAAELGAACIDGLHDGGCLSIVKHFPGHGATNTDSHESTPVVNKSLESLENYELIPFAETLNGADGVMVAHILYPEIDEAHIASQSEVFITGLLRETYGFAGIVMSDDFRMAGLQKQSALDDAAVQFILAGGDLILCGANHSYQRKILSGLYAAVEDGTISEARLNESVYRILSAKMRVTGWDPFDGKE